MLVRRRASSPPCAENESTGCERVPRLLEDFGGLCRGGAPSGGWSARPPPRAVARGGRLLTFSQTPNLGVPPEPRRAASGCDLRDQIPVIVKTGSSRKLDQIIRFSTEMAQYIWLSSISRTSRASYDRTRYWNRRNKIKSKLSELCSSRLVNFYTSRIVSLACVNRKALKTGHFLARSTLDSPAKTESDPVYASCTTLVDGGLPGKGLRSGAGDLNCAAATWVPILLQNLIWLTVPVTLFLSIDWSVQSNLANLTTSGVEVTSVIILL